MPAPWRSLAALLLPLLLLLGQLPTPTVAPYCYDCQGCEVAPTELTVRERQKSCEACFKIVITSKGRRTVRRSCGSVTCHERLDMRQKWYVMNLVTGENGGRQPEHWKFSCCTADRCNAAPAPAAGPPPLLLLLLLLIAALLAP